MNLDELRTVQSKERSKDSLQHLRESFYADVADYVADLRERRDSAAEQAESPFDDPEVNRLTDEIHTAEEVVEAIYERRVGKVVKRASLAAAGMPADEEGLTSEEQELFAELVETIETNKEAVLDVLAGEDAGIDMSGGASTESSASGATTSTPEATPDPGDAPVPSESAPSGAAGDSSTEDGADVSAADVMGGDSAGGPGATVGDTTPSDPGASDPSGTDGDGTRPASAEAAAVADAGDDGESRARGTADSQDDTSGDGEPATDPESDSGPLDGLDERTTVRLTSDVGEIFGVDERTYDLEREDVVTLPEANAEPLLERGAAEKLE